MRACLWFPGTPHPYTPPVLPETFAGIPHSRGDEGWAFSPGTHKATGRRSMGGLR